MNPWTVLLADDHAIVRRGLRSILSVNPSWKICAEAENGREAVAAVRQHRPDVVIMDIHMPELDGIEATRQIMELCPKTQVMILSAYDSESFVRQALHSGARGYVLKSDVHDDLTACVEALCDGQLYFTARVRGYLGETSRTEKTLLTARERDVLQLLAEGKSNKEIAAAIGLSVRTVECHRGNLMNKLEIHSLSELVRYAIQHEIARR